MAKYTYEESVRWVRQQPELVDAITLSYLDRDNRIAADRFERSEEFREIATILNLASGPLKILDLGCGNGIASYAFARLGHQVSALDPDQSSDVGLGAIARLLPLVEKGTIETYQGFAESLPFGADIFDVVYTRQALHHFRDLQAGLKECARVLKPGGRLLATREHVVNDEGQLAVFLREHLLHKMHGGENAYPLKKYLDSLRKADFRVLRCFAPYDSVINHFPETNVQLRDRLLQGLAKKAHLGPRLASTLLSFRGVESLGRGYLSWKACFPGRLYSFLCEKARSSSNL